MAQLFSPWKCLSKRRCWSGTNSLPHCTHRWMEVRHVMTLRFTPLGVSTRSKALLTLGSCVRTCLVTLWMRSLLLHTGHREATTTTCWDALIDLLGLVFLLRLCFRRVL